MLHVRSSWYGSEAATDVLKASSNNDWPHTIKKCGMLNNTDYDRIKILQNSSAQRNYASCLCND